VNKRIIVRNGRSPFQFVLSAVCGLSGFVGLVVPAPGTSNVIAKVFGDAGPSFYLALLFSSLIVLVGMLLPRGTSGRFVHALQVERIGLWPLAGACLAYGAAILAVSGSTALVGAALTGGIGIAAIVRIRIITTDLRKVDELLALDATREERPEGDV
jgi:hypothetical protein